MSRSAMLREFDFHSVNSLLLKTSHPHLYAAHVDAMEFWLRLIRDDAASDQPLDD